MREADAAIIRVSEANFRLLQLLLQQIERVLEVPGPPCRLGLSLAGTRLQLRSCGMANAESVAYEPNNVDGMAPPPPSSITSYLWHDPLDAADARVDRARHAVRTGLSCRYDPPPDQPVTWVTSVRHASEVAALRLEDT
jgi:hypothetical protein